MSKNKVELVDKHVESFNKDVLMNIDDNPVDLEVAIDDMQYNLGDRITVKKSKKNIEVYLDNQLEINISSKNIYRFCKYIITSLQNKDFCNDVIAGNEDFLVKDIWKKIVVENNKSTIDEVFDNFFSLFFDKVKDYCIKHYQYNNISKSSKEVKYICIKFDKNDDTNLHIVSWLQKLLFPVYLLSKFKGIVSPVVSYICNNIQEVCISIDKIKELVDTRVDSLWLSNDRTSLFRWFEVVCNVSKEIIKTRSYREIVNNTLISAYNVNSMPAYIISILDRHLYTTLLMPSEDSISYYNNVSCDIVSRNNKRRIESIAFDTAVMKYIIPFNKYIIDNGYISSEEIDIIVSNYKRNYQFLKYIIIPYITRCGFMYHQFTLSSRQIDIAIFLYILLQNYKMLEPFSKLFISKKVEDLTTRIPNESIINSIKTNGLHVNDEVNKYFIVSNIKKMVQEISGRYVNLLNNTTFDIFANDILTEYLNYINKIIYSPGLMKLSFGYLTISNSDKLRFI